MKKIVLLALTAMSLIMLLGSNANARYYGHGHVGIYLGAPFIGVNPWGYYPSPYYSPYYTPPVVIQQPNVYVEQAAPSYNYAPIPNARPSTPPPTTAMAPQAGVDHSWFYCMDTKTYYPYVQTCQSPWQRVTPQPPR